ncbi:MAG TPA: NADH-quinone oxidoreductase subunit J/K, partial [Rikenellaceae bacterium]|nr:NADH-quinone oxidoreductase subunit J/K [Rikenellaceae bacterium]
MAQYKMHLLVCGGTGCRASQSEEVVANLITEIKKQGLENDAQVVTTGCFGFCEKGPIVKIIPDNTFYTQVTPEDCAEIISEHVLKGRRVHRLLYEDPETLKHIEDSKHMGFYQKQIRIALRNCGFIDPENIDEYIARDGYAAIGKVLTEMTPAEAVDLLKKSGLRGRGGGGFPT